MQMDEMCRQLLSKQSIEVSSCLYSNTEDSLYQGQFRGQPASIRMQRIFPGCDEEGIEKEMQIMRALEHIHIVKLLDCFRLVSEIADFLVVVTEFWGKSAEQDMAYRQKAGYSFTESELWTLSVDLISAFAYMQNHGFAHRCISPASLYLTKDSWVVGNFSSSTVSPPGQCLRSIQGQSYYHSPKIYNAILKGKTEVAHNVYKSDVYSLGLTLLALAKLEVPQVIAMAGHTIEAIQEEVEGCRYSRSFKDFLYAMLDVEEETRGDFRDFEEWTRNKPVSPPIIELPENQTQLQEKISKEEELPRVEEEEKAMESVKIEGEKVEEDLPRVKEEEKVAENGEIEGEKAKEESPRVEEEEKQAANSAEKGRKEEESEKKASDSHATSETGSTVAGSPDSNKKKPKYPSCCSLS